jgi:hypothetical protein
MSIQARVNAPGRGDGQERGLNMEEYGNVFAVIVIMIGVLNQIIRRARSNNRAAGNTSADAAGTKAKTTVQKPVKPARIKPSPASERPAGFGAPVTFGTPNPANPARFRTAPVSPKPEGPAVSPAGTVWAPPVTKGQDSETDSFPYENPWTQRLAYGVIWREILDEPRAVRPPGRW